MSIQVAFFGSNATSMITASAAVVEAFRAGSAATAGISFKTNGQEIGIRNLSSIGFGNWVTLTTTANQWEIRAVLDSGTSPSTGVLGTWQDFSSDRSWTIVASPGETVTCALTFEFRKVGGTSAEFTVTGTFLTAEATEII